MGKFAFRNDEEHSARTRNQEYEEALGHRLAEAGHSKEEVIRMIGTPLHSFDRPTRGQLNKEITQASRALSRSKVAQGYDKYHDNVIDAQVEATADKINMEDRRKGR